MDATTILVVAPNDTLQELLPALLQAVGCRVEFAVGHRAALRALQRRLPTLLLLHMDACSADTQAFVARLRAEYARRVPIVILGLHYDAAALAQTVAADAWLPLPFGIDELYAVVARLTKTVPGTP